MQQSSQERFFNELDLCVNQLKDFLLSERYTKRFHPSDLLEAVTLYTVSGGKRLRPSILMWCCGAVGGDPSKAVPAAAAVELFHTWSLVHDDIIDRDNTRRGDDTVHARFQKLAKDRYTGISDEEAYHYGVSVAVLTGDVQHGWAISMLSEMSRLGDLDPEITLFLIDNIDTEVLNQLVEGEILDFQFPRLPISAVTLENIEDMIWKKTGVLYSFCARAGALIGLETTDLENPYVRALESFSKNCGIAFQLQDDILGVVGDKNVLGKPVGSDIREGKRTTIVHYSYMEASDSERSLIENSLGNPDASESDINKVVKILVERGGIDKTYRQARKYIEEAYPQLEELPDSKHRDLLRNWADFMISRKW